MTGGPPARPGPAARPGSPARPGPPAQPGSGRWQAAYALLPGGLARDVVFDVEGGRFTAVTLNATAGNARPLPGVVLPGLANAHSHAFHRALRGRTHRGGGTFWSWRAGMYALAGRLDPDSYLALATATYAEMALAGISSVGEFHYLRHDPAGRHYTDPNAMAHSLRAAAELAGVRLTLLDAAYLAGGLDRHGHMPVAGVQRRFADADASAWAERLEALSPTPNMRVGVAIHSVRAVPRPAIRTVVRVAAGRPLHVHVSEQPAENEACLGFYGLTPTQLLAAEGALGGHSCAVHATHLCDGDVAALGRGATTVCLCPTTERDLADGIGPARRLADAGCPLALGSDQHAVVDLMEEARAIEMHERLATRQRGRFTPAELLAAATRHAVLGWADAGQLAPGTRADLVAVRLDTPRTAGCAPDQVLFAATAADVDTVVVDGRVVVSGGRHRLGDVGALLDAAITPLWAA
jgi:formiminoglutamate deiminase